MTIDRRTLLLSTTGLLLAGSALDLLASPAPPAPTAGNGKPGEFDFLAGSWKIHHRRRKAGADEWDEFPGEATCWSILNGVGSIEELRIPARNFSGMGIRLLDLEKRVWTDFWVNSKSGVLACPGQTGSFHEGIGTFTADDVHEGRPMKVRGVWDRVTKTSCRWHQATSVDGGKTWVHDWFMDWTRV